MRRVNIEDITFSDIENGQYNWLIVGVGVESRWDFVAKKLIAQNKTVHNVLAFCFTDIKQNYKSKVRATLQGLCSDKHCVHVHSVGSNSSARVFALLNKYLRTTKKIDVLLDYSAMSRVWYASILLWFYNRTRDSSMLGISLVYSEGRYSRKIAEKEVVIDDISAVPGCEGIVYRQVPTSVVFGLGFYGFTSLCACEQLEPNDIYTIMTTDKPIQGFSIEEQRGNMEMIHRAERSYKIPLNSLESAYRCIMSIASYCQTHGHEVILVPMGPKPHVMASILVSLSDRRICTMRVRHRRYDSDIAPTGNIVSTRVNFVDIVTDELS